MRWFFKTDFRSLWLLNATQFLGAMNDNIFKLLVIYLLINVKGAAEAPMILSLAGAIFVIPFLIFSSGAGVLADRISKRTIIVVTKILEVLSMIFGLLVISWKAEGGCYIALFCMAGQSALFGPSKYGIIPEIVEPKMISKANGAITSATYLAIILGTFLASFLTGLTKKNFVLVSAFCILIALLGLLTSLGIRKTAAQGSQKRANPFFLYEIYQSLKLSWKIPYLTPAIFGSAFFLFIGAFTQLNIIPFAMQSLSLDEVGGGYLFLPAAIGIAIGAFLSGQVSKDKIEPGISCICCFAVGILFLFLWFFASSLPIVLIVLIFLGMFGGAFLIPFDAFIQMNSPDAKRGQIIAASNFLSFFGVLLASFFLFLISEELGFSAASGFAFMGILTIISSLILTGRFSTLFFAFFARKILKRFRTLEATIPSEANLFILEDASWLDAIHLYGLFPQLILLVPGRPFRRFPWIKGWIESIRLISKEDDLEELIQFEPHPPLCLFLRKRADREEILSLYQPLLQRYEIKPLLIQYTKTKSEKRFLFWHKKEVTLSFQA